MEQDAGANSRELLPFGSRMIRYSLLNYIGMKRMALAEKKSKSNGSSNKEPSTAQYVVCVKNEDYPASLELRKLYRVISDKNATKSGLLRIVDESGEDYLYPAEYFLPVKLSRDVERAIQLAS